MTDLPLLIFLASVMIAFGYVAGNAKSFNVWKFAILALVLKLFFDAFELTGIHMVTAVSGFLVGYLLPYAHLLEGLRDTLSEAINSVRYKSAYEDIRRKEEEIEELRKQWERQRENEFKQGQDEARRKRHRESEEFRKQHQKNHSENAKQNNSADSQSTGSNSSSYSKNKHNNLDTTKKRHLETLGLDPNKEHSFKEIKMAFRRQASKWHPDKFGGEPEIVIQEASRKFREVKEAFDWLAKIQTRN